MKALILAAGLGKRMRPLTLDTPKPLLKVGQHSLIEHHILALKKANITDIVINTFWLAEKIHQQIGDGSHYGVNINYSDEKGEALETAGGIKKALLQLGDTPFVVVNGDIFCNYTFQQHQLKNKLAHLVLVNNPKHNLKGDFAIENNLLKNEGEPMFTYSGIGYYSPQFFEQTKIEPTPLAPLLRSFADKKQLSAEHFKGNWTDVGTPERLIELNKKQLNVY